MQIELKRLQKKLGITFVYVTHDQEEAMTMSDRIAVMRDGVILQMDSPMEMYDHPKSRFVADFLGESNILFGTMTAADYSYPGRRCAGYGPGLRRGGGDLCLHPLGVLKCVQDTSRGFFCQGAGEGLHLCGHCD